MDSSHAPPFPGFPSTFQADDPRGHLFCFPFAGGGTSYYHRWRKQLEHAVQVVPFCLPGREGRWHDEPYTRLQPLCDDLLAIIVELGLSKVTLFGHSMGGIIAYELARRMIAETSIPLRALIVSAAPAPHRITDRGRRFLTDEELLSTLIHDFSTDFRRSKEEIEFMKLMIPTIRADLTLFETYTPPEELKLPVPILILGGSQDPHVALAKLEAWRDCTSVGTTIRTFPGGHFYWQQQAQETALLKLVGEKLKELT